MKNLILLLLIGLTACTTVQTYDQYLRGWEGQTLAQLTAVYGEPTQEISLREEEKLVVYLKKDGKEVACRTSFLITSTGVIVSWKYEGGKCAAP